MVARVRDVDIAGLVARNVDRGVELGGRPGDVGKPLRAARERVHGVIRHVNDADVVAVRVRDDAVAGFGADGHTLRVV